MSDEKRDIPLGSWGGNRIEETLRGEGTLLPCYPDTCVIINAFLEDESWYPGNDKKIDNIIKSRDLFERFDGATLLTSPMVMAEFIHIATRSDKKFCMSLAEAQKLLIDIYRQQRFSLSVPIIKLNQRPLFNLPELDTTIELSGKYYLENNQEEMVEQIIGPTGGTFIWSSDTAPSQERILLNRTVWHSITLSGAIIDFFLAAASEVANQQGGRLQLQDAFVLSFARGHGVVYFVTTDEEFAQKAGPQPYRDVMVQSLSDYIESELFITNGSYLIR